MNSLPEEVTIKGKKKEIDHSALRRFLKYLEEKQCKWSQLAPQGAGPRPLKLEDEVTAAIENGSASKNVRPAINDGLGFALKGKKQLQLPEHVKMIMDLKVRLAGDSSDLTTAHLNRVKSFLLYLERRNTPWSSLVPDKTASGVPPSALVDAVAQYASNSEHKTDIKAAIRNAFGIDLPWARSKRGAGINA